MEAERFTELNIVFRVGRAANAPFDQAFTACTWLRLRRESALSEQVVDGDNVGGSAADRRPPPPAADALRLSVCVLFFLFKGFIVYCHAGGVLHSCLHWRNL